MKAPASASVCAWTWLLVCACQGGSSRQTAAALAVQPQPSASVAAARSAQTAPTLPEDPVAGARSLLQWRQHLEAEEQERMANYDRRHSSEHRAVVAKLRSAQRSYDQAKTAAAVQRVQSSTLPALDGVRKQIDKIDHWRVSSNLLKDYDAVLEALATTYPAARLDELAGRASAAVTARRDVHAHFEHIDEWLAHAEQAEDE